MHALNIALLHISYMIIKLNVIEIEYILRLLFVTALLLRIALELLYSLYRFCLHIKTALARAEVATRMGGDWKRDQGRYRKGQKPVEFEKYSQFLRKRNETIIS